MSVTEIGSSSQYKKIIANDLAAVCFENPGCGHCMNFKSPFNYLAESYPQVSFARLNIKSGFVSPPKKGFGTPTTYIYHNSKAVAEIIGNDPYGVENAIKDWMKKLGM